MRMLIVFFLLLFAFPCFAADKALEPSYIYDEILNESNKLIKKFQLEDL